MGFFLIIKYNFMRWHRHHVEIQESILTVLCQPQYRDVIHSAVREVRKDIKNAIYRIPDFQRSFQPLTCEQDASPVIKRMCLAAGYTNVGPMAAVAGAVAEYVLYRLLEAGATEAVVDNGGDIALKIKAPVTIGIFTGRFGPHDFGFLVQPQAAPLSICTSSGVVGHSKSFGRADAAVVLSHNACLADAAATALGNKIRYLSDLNNAFDLFADKPAISGAVVFLNGKIALFGRLPKIVKVKINNELITRGRSYE